MLDSSVRYGGLVFTRKVAVQISCPPDEVFAFIADARNRPLRSMGRDYVLTWEIVEHDPPSRQTIESTSGPFATTLAYQLSAQDGGTLVEFSVTGRPTGMLRLLQPLIARNTQKNLDRGFPRLKRVLESGGAPEHP
jgi:hypothetical protein